MLPGALLFLTALPALGADLRGRLVSNAQLNLSSIPLDARVDLDFGAASALFRADGSFELPGVAPGKHVVQPLIPGFAVHSFIVNLPEADAESAAPHVQTYFADRLPLPTSDPSLPYPLEVAALGVYNYYTAPLGMNIVQMFKSPMMLMMMFTAVMAIFLPKITASIDMDPEMQKEFRDQQKAINKMQNSAMDWSGSLSGMLAAGATGKDAEGPAPGPAPGPATPQQQQRTAGGGAARGTPGRRGGKRR